jgi:hypothetical protein
MIIESEISAIADLGDRPFRFGGIFKLPAVIDISLMCSSFTAL